MAISLPLVDSSNSAHGFTTSKRPLYAHTPHTHLLRSSPRKSPPTCTVSLASAHVDEPGSILSDFPASCVPFPHSELQDDSASCGEDRSDSSTRRPRARTSHVVTPKRPASSISKTPVPKPSGRVVKPKSQLSISPADARFTALLERSISYRLATATSQSAAGVDMEMQDALLAARLRATLARSRHRTRTPSPPPRALTIPARPPSVGVSLLFSGSTAAFPDCTSLPQSSTRSPAPGPAPLPLRVAFAVTSRARSGSSSSGNSITSKDTAPMPALVASLMLRRHEYKRSGSGTHHHPQLSSADAAAAARKSRLSASARSRTPSPLANVMIIAAQT